jgi:hypothetical protein
LAEGRERQRPAASAPVRAAREAVNRREVKQVAAKGAAVLDMLIDGKQLRFLTGAEISRLGTGFARIAGRVPANALCGECLTECEAAKLIDLKAHRAGGGAS